MKQKNGKSRMNRPSILLTQQENYSVFSLLGHRCQCMSTAVVQLFTTVAPAHSAWIKRLTGVACFVRDSTKCSYFIQVYCMIKHELVWEEEMYDSITINRPHEFLITFEGEYCWVALSFASEIEANIFNVKMTSMTKHLSQKMALTHGGYDGCVESNQIHAMQQPPLTSNISAFKNGHQKKLRKLTKNDISLPTDFKHITHIGLTDKKLLNTEDVSSEMGKFFKKASVLEVQLRDRSTRNYIYDVIESNNVSGSVQLEKQQLRNGLDDERPLTLPPVVPLRNKQTQRTAQSPPLPPSAELLKSTRMSLKRPPPICVQHIQWTGNIQEPPLPLRSLPSATAVPPPPTIHAKPLALSKLNTSRNALIESIERGTTLRKVDQALLSTGHGSSDTRTDLMKDIRQGFALRPASERELGNKRDSSNGIEDVTYVIADALRKALEQRKEVLHTSDTSSSSDNNEWDD